MILHSAMAREISYPRVLAHDHVQQMWGLSYSSKSLTAYASNLLHFDFVRTQLRIHHAAGKKMVHVPVLTKLLAMKAIQRRRGSLSVQSRASSVHPAAQVSS
jgi:hypothetical protein